MRGFISYKSRHTKDAFSHRARRQRASCSYRGAYHRAYLKNSSCSVVVLVFKLSAVVSEITRSYVHVAWPGSIAMQRGNATFS